MSAPGVKVDGFLGGAGALDRCPIALKFLTVTTDNFSRREGWIQKRGTSTTSLSTLVVSDIGRSLSVLLK